MSATPETQATDTPKWHDFYDMPDHGVTHLRLIPSDNPYVVDVIYHHNDFGLQGGQVIRRPDVSIRDIVPFVLENVAEGFENPDPPTEGELDELDLATETAMFNGMRFSADEMNEQSLLEVFDGVPNGQESDPKTMNRGEGYRDFLESHLSEGGLALMRSFPAKTNFANGGYRSASGMLDYLALLSGGDIEAREQVLTHYPLMLSQMLNSGKLTEAIDRRENLMKALQTDTGCSDQALRSFRRVNGIVVKARAEGKKLHNLDILSNTPKTLQSCDALHPDQIPLDYTEMSRAIRLTEGVFNYCRETGLQDEFARKSIKAIDAKGWTEDCPLQKMRRFQDSGLYDYLNDTSRVLVAALVVDRLEKCGHFDFDRLSQTAADLFSDRDVSPDDAREMRNYLELHTSLTRIANTGDGQVGFGLTKGQLAITKAIGEKASFKDLRAHSTRWHHITRDLRSKAVDSTVNVEWAPLVGEVALSGGLHAFELASSNALKTQGDVEKHCVGSYVSVVLEGNQYNGVSALFSIEGSNGVESTIELKVKPNYSPEGNGYTFEEVQHKAYNNSSPSGAARLAAAQLIAQLSELAREDVKSYVEGIHRHSHNLQRDAAAQIQKAGINIFSKGVSQTVLDTYREVLPKRMRQVTLAGIEAIVEDGNPEMVKSLDHEIQRQVKVFELVERVDLNNVRLERLTDIEVPTAPGDPGM